MTHLAHLLRIASTVACGIVLVAFAAWASDETKAASTAQAAQTGGPAAATPAGATTAPLAVAPEPEHGGVRGVIESANDELVAPFDGVVASSNTWVQHGVPALLALLAYGVLARLLIAYLPPS